MFARRPEEVNAMTKIIITDDDRDYAGKLKLLDVATRRDILDAILANSKNRLSGAADRKENLRRYHALKKLLRMK